MKRVDADIQLDVLAELAWDRRVQPNEIVVVRGDHLTLMGTVHSCAEKRAAERSAGDNYG